MTTPSAPRVLVVDNDPRICQLLIINLSKFGYDVRSVAGNGAQILEEAVIVAQAFRPHVAIVDLRLVDDFVDERSGLDLLPDLNSARCILFSAHLEADVTLTAARVHNAFAWVDKYRPERLYAAVARATQEASAESRAITIQWPRHWARDEMVRRLFADSNNLPHSSILDDMVAQLFTDNQQFRPVAVNDDSNGLRSVVRGRSAVIKIYPDELEPKVLKLGNAARLAEEDQRYRQYVKDQMPGLHATQLEQRVNFWDLGGAVYSFIGSSQQLLPTFAMHYATAPTIEALVEPLRHFFQVVWRNYYERKRPATFPSLYAAYDEVFHLETRLPQIDQSLLPELRSHIALPVHNPSAWLQRFAPASIIPTAQQAVTHGDLHGDNLFVEGDRAWIIDFERTGPGHALRDFIELEADIFTRLVDGQRVEWSTLLALALALVEPRSPTSLLPVDPALRANTEADKARAVIQEIRQLAHTAVGHQDQREYLWGLLLDALFIAAVGTMPRAQRLRAMLLSTVICARLEGWDESNNKLAAG
ncbi:MAG: phosphotransferase [Caldilineaceae bacterium]